jgi:hypothetical protein
MTMVNRYANENGRGLCNVIVKAASTILGQQLFDRDYIVIGRAVNEFVEGINSCAHRCFVNRYSQFGFLVFNLMFL